MVARGGDRVVSQTVALLAGLGVEGSFDDALAAPVRFGPAERGEDRLEALVGGGDRLAHLLDLKIVLDEAQLGEGLRQLGVELRAALGDSRAFAQVDHLGLDGGVDAGDDRHLHLAEVFGQGVPEGVDRGAFEAGEGGHLLERGPCAHPEFAVARVGVELLRRSRGARMEIEGRLVFVSDRVEDQHRIRFELAAEPRHVGEGRMRPKTVVAVVVAHLVTARRHHEAHPAEPFAQLRVARREEVGRGRTFRPLRAGPPV